MTDFDCLLERLMGNHLALTEQEQVASNAYVQMGLSDLNSSINSLKKRQRRAQQANIDWLNAVLRMEISALLNSINVLGTILYSDIECHQGLGAAYWESCEVFRNMAHSSPHLFVPAGLSTNLLSMDEWREVKPNMYAILKDIPLSVFKFEDSWMVQAGIVSVGIHPSMEEAKTFALAYYEKLFSIPE